MLVEGQGPLGSAFKREDFTDREVRDTDGDGLPEFVDAWGEPLQFYRWPIFYHSDLQRGVPLNGSFNTAAGSVTVGNGTMNYPYMSHIRSPRAGYPRPEPAVAVAFMVVEYVQHRLDRRRDLLQLLVEHSAARRQSTQ